MTDRDTTVPVSPLPDPSKDLDPPPLPWVDLSAGASHAEVRDVDEATVTLSPQDGVSQNGATQASGSSPSGSQSLAKASGIMAAGSVVSRLTGFIRTAAIGAAIGATGVGSAYQSAYALPLQVYELLLGGILTSVLVPVLVKARKQDSDGGDSYTSALLSLATVALAITTALAVIAAPLLTMLFVGSETSDDKQALITALSYLMLPTIACYGLAALLGAVLNTRGHFAAPMWAPILNNIVVITIAVIFIALPGPNPLTTGNITAGQIALLGAGTTLGVVSQVIALWPALRRVGFRWRWQLRLRGLGLREIGKLALWMLAYVGVSQVGVLMILRLANLSDDRGGPGPWVHNSAFLLFMMAHGIVAVSVITALMPRMSTAAIEGRFGDLAQQLSQGVRLSAVVLLPATAAYVALGIPLAVTAFQWGEVNADSAHAIGLATVAAGVGLIPFAVSQLQIFAFYALRDTRTPALVNIPVVLTKVLVAYLLFTHLRPSLAVVGLMTANTVSYLVAGLVSGWMLRARIGSIDGARIVRSLTQLTLASAIAGAIAWGISYGITSWLGDGKLGSLVAIGVGGIALILAFIAGAVLLRIREVTDLWATISPRIPGLR